MNIDIFPLSEGNKRKTILKLVSRFGIPVVRKDLAIYFQSNGGREVHLRFRNKKCQIYFINPETDEEFRPKIYINTNRTSLKSLFRFLKDLGFDKASIGIATCFNFYNKNKVFLELLTDTFIGDFVQVGYSEKDSAIRLLNTVEDMGLKKLSRSGVKNLIQEKNVEYHRVIDDLNVVNNIIYEFSKDAGLHIEINDFTLKDKVANFNNDYTFLEKAYRLVFNSEMLSSKPLGRQFIKNFKPVSIVVPCFNSGETYLKTLASINSQSLPDDLMAEVQVILVDDGSKESVKDVFKKNNCKYRFDCKIVRLDPNSGLASARNAGISQAVNDILIFLDSDMMISKDYLLEHSLRNQLIPNGILLSFKQNLKPSDKILEETQISKGLRKPNISKDIRVKKVIQKGACGLYEVSGKIATEILSSTNYFKDFNYGRNFGIYDLPTMVIGHNMSCRKENVELIGGFSNYFRGWGLEDSYFGAKMIAEGNYVIPVLSCGAYHIDHPPRSGSEKKKAQELELNLARYKKLLSESY